MSNGLPPPEDVAGLQEVAAVLHRARRVIGPGPAFVVCICGERNEPVARATLDRYDQVQRFSRYMARLGYAANPIRLGLEMHGCDVVYLQQDSARDIFDAGGAVDSGPLPL